MLLQPFIYDPNEKNKHKFMVQYMYLNENEMQYSVNDILNMVCMDSLLTCFLKYIIAILFYSKLLNWIEFYNLINHKD